MTTSNTLPVAADAFQVREDLTFLNHGSFGACPRPVFEVYQEWQRRLEADPVEFLGRRLHEFLYAARESLAAVTLAATLSSREEYRVDARTSPLTPGSASTGIRPSSTLITPPTALPP